MKLSAAIRIGSMTTKQIRGMSKDNSNGRCAIGAALEAVNFQYRRDDWAQALSVQFPEASWRVSHPIDGHYTSVLDAIWTLNDLNCWSRNQIADWVETLELSRQSEASTVNAEVVIK